VTRQAMLDCPRPSSSLAAASLLDLGLHRATDVVGGYHALKAEGVLV
jgi:hypothetical protein